MSGTRNARASARSSAKRQRCIDEFESVKPSKKAREALSSARDDAQPCSSARSKENGPADAHSTESTPAPAAITCRTHETERLHAVLRSSLTDGQGIAVYIPGQPGTGKTHTVRTVLQHLPYGAWGTDAPSVALINCTARKRCTLGKVVLAALHDSATQNRRGGATAQQLHVSSGGQGVESFALPGGGKVSSDEAALRHLRDVATGARSLGKGMCVVVLDELELACKQARDFVHGLFALTKLPRSRVVVAGIANRLDLCDALVRHAGASVPLTMIAFHSYSARQLLDLLRERYADGIEGKALELVAKRVSAATGDMRTAISVCQTAITRSNARCPDGAAPGGDTEAAQNSARLVSVGEVAAALQECRSGGSAQAQAQVASIRKLPGQQQLLLCTLAIARGGALAAAPAAAKSPPSSAAATPLRACFTVRSGLGKAAARTPLATLNGGKAGTPTGCKTPTGKAANKAFPIADDAVLATPTSVAVAGGARTLGAPAARVADLTMRDVFAKYSAAAREAGLAPVAMPQLQGIVGDLQSSGLLETRGGGVARGARGAAELRISLSVSTEDVKHALVDTRMLRPLVQQLP